MLLVQPLPGGRRAAGSGRRSAACDQQGRPGGVEGRVRVGDRSGSTARALAVDSCAAGHEDDRDARRGAGVELHVRTAGPVGVGPGDGQAAVDAGRGVVGVALELGREVVGEGEVDARPGRPAGRVARSPVPQRFRRRWRRRTSRGRGRAGRVLRHRRRRPRARGRRAARQAARASRGRRGAPRRAAPRRPPSPSTSTRAPGSSVTVDAAVVPEPERQPDRVEAGAEVGAARRHPHLDGTGGRRARAARAQPSSPRAPAAVNASTGTRVGLTSEPSASRAPTAGP